MRLISILMFFCLVYCVTSRNAEKALTESMGQEVIEIGTPVKEMPQELEEEPSAEVDDDDEKETTTTILPATKGKKATTDSRRKVKDIDKIDNAQEDEEARIEKELAEIYKDTDYKADSSELNKEAATNNTLRVSEAKPIARSRTNFKFQPEGKHDIERWRTSVDEITCDKSYTKKMAMDDDVKPAPKSAFRFTVNLFLLFLVSTTIGFTH